MKKIILTMLMMMAIAANGQGINNIRKGGLEMPMTIASAEEELLAEDIGEMLMVGFRGTTIEAASDIEAAIKEEKIGGVILFEYDAPSGKHHRNIQSPKQLRQLCEELQKLSGGRLFIAVDQEGGKVQRLKKVDGFEYTPSAEEMGKKGADSVYAYSLAVGNMLRAAGINLNFAPCADLNINVESPAIGKLGRSFGKEPKEVTACCKAWIKGHRKAGVQTCLKHFPGHGSATEDTHEGLSDISESWIEAEAEPYRELIKSQMVEMVMVGHLIHREIGGEMPTSLSKECIEEYLRKRLGYKGLVITDDLMMGAIEKNYGLAETLEQALNAGVDILCLSNNIRHYNPQLAKEAVATITELVKEGKVDARRIHESAERIRKVKKEMGLGTEKKSGEARNKKALKATK